MYPKTTIAIDKMGSLYIWEGEHDTYMKSHYWIIADGREADIFIQEGACSMGDFLQYLSDEELEELKHGRTIISTNIPDDYFLQN